MSLRTETDRKLKGTGADGEKNYAKGGARGEVARGAGEGMLKITARLSNRFKTGTKVMLGSGVTIAEAAAVQKGQS